MRLEWNSVGKRFFEVGVDHGVFYPRSGPGVAWDGLVSVNETASGGESESYYLNGVKYADVIASEDFDATIEAFSAPPEFDECEGIKQLMPGLFVGQQPRKTFGFSYRTLLGNDLEGTDYGYKLHLVYNATASPSPRSSSTLAGSTSAPTRSWSVNTVPPPASLYKPTAHFVFNSTMMDPYLLTAVESVLYGREDRDPRLPTQDDILNILGNQITEPLSALI